MICFHAMGHFSGLLSIIFSGHRPQRWDQDLDRELTGDVSPGATQRIPAMDPEKQEQNKNTIYGIFHPMYIIYGGQK